MRLPVGALGARMCAVWRLQDLSGLPELIDALAVLELLRLQSLRPVEVRAYEDAELQDDLLRCAGADMVRCWVCCCAASNRG